MQKNIEECNKGRLQKNLENKKIQKNVKKTAEIVRQKIQKHRKMLKQLKLCK